MSNPDPELEILGLIEVAFHDLDEKARLRILCWAIDWHQEHAEHKKTSALQLIEPSMRRLDAETRRRVLGATAVLLDVEAKPATLEAEAVAVRRISPTFSSRYQPLVRRGAIHCSLCGNKGHNRRNCDRFPATAKVLAK